jgi:hypothetical protein
MYELPKPLGESILSVKEQYDTMCQAVKYARSVSLSEERIQPIIYERQQLRNNHLINIRNIVNKLTFTNNVVSIGDGWYGIRYQINSKLDLKIEKSTVSNMSLLKMENCRSRDLSTRELDSLLPALIDYPALDEYVDHIKARAEKVIQQVAGSTVVFREPTKKPEIAKVSWHASIRWVERLMDMTNEEAETYTRGHLQEVQDDILESWGRAIMVWQGTDTTDYLFDATENVMFVTSNNTIITLYEEDFGFDKHINTMIVHEQVKVLAQERELLSQYETSFTDAMSVVQSDLADVQVKKKRLQAMIAKLDTKEKDLIQHKVAEEHRIKLSCERFNNQFNKLFKRAGD